MTHNDHSKVAMIGVGMVSQTYADALSNLTPRISLRGVLARRPASAADFLDRHRNTFGAARVYDSVLQLADDDELDFVIVATPPDARAEIVESLARAGKPILMEKPVERSLRSATELVVACEQADVPLGIVLQHRARPSVSALRERATQEPFGALQAAEINVPWWRPQSYYDAPGRGTYARDGGGVLINQAIHTIDLALQFTGPVARVSAFGATTGFHRMESEDFVTAGLSFSNGAVGSLFAGTGCFPGRTESIHLHYRHVSVTLESAALTLHWQDGRKEVIGESQATGSGADPMAFTSDWHQGVIEDFAHAVRSGQAPMVTGRSALGVHAVIDAIARSANTGEPASPSTTEPTTGARPPVSAHDLGVDWGSDWDADLLPDNDTAPSPDADSRRS